MRRQNALNADRDSMCEMCRTLGVDADRAWNVYQNAVEAGRLQGRDALVMQGAAMLIAARRTGTPVTIEEIAALTGKRNWLLSKCARLVVGDDLPGAAYGDFVARGMSRLDIPEDMRCMIDGVAAGVRTDMSPPVRAAVVLYAAVRRAGMKVSRKSVGEAVGVNPATLKLYVKRGGVLLPEVAPK